MVLAAGPPGASTHPSRALRSEPRRAPRGTRQTEGAVGVQHPVKDEALVGQGRGGGGRSHGPCGAWGSDNQLPEVKPLAASQHSPGPRGHWTAEPEGTPPQKITGPDRSATSGNTCATNTRVTRALKGTMKSLPDCRPYFGLKQR